MDPTSIKRKKTTEPKDHKSEFTTTHGY